MAIGKVVGRICFGRARGEGRDDPQHLPFLSVNSSCCNGGFNRPTFRGAQILSRTVHLESRVHHQQISSQNYGIDVWPDWRFIPYSRATKLFLGWPKTRDEKRYRNRRGAFPELPTICRSLPDAYAADLSAAQ